MKSKLSLFLFALSAYMIAGLTSCDSDGYSLGDMYVSLAAVETYDNGEARSFTLDGGKTLFVAATTTNYIPKNERVLINYTILGDNYEGYDHAIRLNYYMEDVLTKPIVYIPADDQKKQDSIGYDKIKVETLFARRGYITIEFGYNMGGKDAHMLNLVALEEDKKQEGDEPIKLQFRHNIGNDEELFGSGLMYVCFRLDDYIEANEDRSELSFEVSWEEYNGETKSVTLKYPLTKDGEENSEIE